MTFFFLPTSSRQCLVYPQVLPSMVSMVEVGLFLDLKHKKIIKPLSFYRHSFVLFKWVSLSTEFSFQTDNTSVFFSFITEPFTFFKLHALHLLLIGLRAYTVYGILFLLKTHLWPSSPSQVEAPGRPDRLTHASGQSAAPPGLRWTSSGVLEALTCGLWTG